MNPELIQLIETLTAQGVVGEDLVKALSSGSSYTIPSAAAADGFPLRRESLEQQLKVFTAQMRNFAMFPRLPSVMAKNVDHQYTRAKSLGLADGVGGFASEGSEPLAVDGLYERVQVKLKILAEQGAITDTLLDQDTIPGDLLALETDRVMRRLMSIAERKLFDGDSAMNTLEFDGIMKSLSSGNIINNAGATLTQDQIHNAASRIETAFGRPTTVVLSPNAHKSLSVNLYPLSRLMLGEPGRAGLAIEQQLHPEGTLSLVRDVYLDRNRADLLAVNVAAVGDSSLRPATPAITTQPVAAANANSKFIAGDAGAYIYQIRAVNASGASACVTTSAVTVAVGDRVTTVITAPSAPLPLYYEIYRTAAGGAAATAGYIFRVAYPGSGTLTFTDDNEFRPFCSEVFVMEESADVIAVAKLGDMMRVPLAKTAQTVRWFQRMTVAPMIYQPQKIICIKNVA